MQIPTKKLKELVLWMRKEKVAAFSVGEFQVSFSPAAFVADLPESPTDTKTEEEIAAERKKREEEILYHSAG